MPSSGALRRENAESNLAVIARSAATKQSSFLFRRTKAGLRRFARNDELNRLFEI
jgi:hypothetical protein